MSLTQLSMVEVDLIEPQEKLIQTNSEIGKHTSMTFQINFSQIDFHQFGDLILCRIEQSVVIALMHIDEGEKHVQFCLDTQIHRGLLHNKQVEWINKTHLGVINNKLGLTPIKLNYTKIWPKLCAQVRVHIKVYFSRSSSQFNLNKFALFLHNENHKLSVDNILFFASLFKHDH